MIDAGADVNALRNTATGGQATPFKVAVWFGDSEDGREILKRIADAGGRPTKKETMSRNYDADWVLDVLGYLPEPLDAN